MGQGMIVTWTLVAIAFAALATLAYVALRNRTRQVDLDKAVRAFQSLDIEAFTNLIDPEEDAFLRDNLSPKKFREIKRQRAWAALLYSREAGRAAAALAKDRSSREKEFRRKDRRVRSSAFGECFPAPIADYQRLLPLSG